MAPAWRRDARDRGRRGARCGRVLDDGDVRKETRAHANCRPISLRTVSRMSAPVSRGRSPADCARAQIAGGWCLRARRTFSTARDGKMAAETAREVRWNARTRSGEKVAWEVAATP